MKTPFEILKKQNPLERCICLIGYFLHNDTNTIESLAEDYYDIMINVEMPFRQYLDSNLIKYDTLKGKQDYLKKVIFEFQDILNYLSDNPVFSYSITEKTESYQKQVDFSQYVESAWWSISGILLEIQNKCLTFRLDVFRLFPKPPIFSHPYGIEFTIVHLHRQTEDTEKTKKHLMWTGSKQQLEKLCNGLIHHGFIDPSTDLQAFAAIFEDDLTNITAIKWRGSNRLLSYIFSQMCTGNFIVKEWQSIIEKYKLFQNKSGKYLNAQDLATALNSINDPQRGLNPGGSEKIDMILKNIKTG
jgi:hypothetical protein